MLRDGYRQLETSPLNAFVPGVTIFLAVLSLNIVGDALRDRLDVRLRGSAG
jgi:peptide/nickel transport system permease protein